MPHRDGECEAAELPVANLLPDRRSNMHMWSIVPKPGELVLYFAILHCASCTGAPVTPLWEVADTSLPDLAFVRADPHWGSVVIYNPEYCEQIGAACGFFRTHAYAHVHLFCTVIIQPEDRLAMYPPTAEAQADCFVAKHGKANEVYAAVQFLREVDVAGLSWKVYGDPVRRADAIRKCAIQGGNWIGDPD